MPYVIGHVRYLSASDPRKLLWQSLKDDNQMSGIVVVGAVQYTVWSTGKFESINMEAFIDS